MSHKKQPPPKGGEEPVTPHVKEFMKAVGAKPEVFEVLDKQVDYGFAKYGQTLMTHDGRSPRDIAEELVDAVQYTIKWDLERQQLIAALRRVQRLVESGGSARLSKAVNEVVDAILPQREIPFG